MRLALPHRGVESPPLYLELIGIEAVRERGQQTRVRTQIGRIARENFSVFGALTQLLAALEQLHVELILLGEFSLPVGPIAKHDRRCLHEEKQLRGIRYSQLNSIFSQRYNQTHRAHLSQHGRVLCERHDLILKIVDVADLMQHSTSKTQKVKYSLSGNQNYGDE